MARFTAIEDTSETILAVIEAALQRAFPLAVDRPTAQVAQPEDFDNLPPAAPTPPVITIWLYRITPEAATRNGPRRTLASGAITRPLFPLELHYVITAWSRDVNTTHALMGLIVQAMYDRAEIGSADLVGAPGRPPAWDPGDSVQVHMEALSTEELSRIWDSGEAAYRLSLAYRVQVVGIEPSESLSELRVVGAALMGDGAP